MDTHLAHPTGHRKEVTKDTHWALPTGPEGFDGQRLIARIKKTLKLSYCLSNPTYLIYSDSPVTSSLGCWIGRLGPTE